MDNELRTYIAEILQDTHLLALATIDEKGPWATILAFVHDKNLNIYWMSTKESRHSVALTKNNQCAISISKTTNPQDENKGLQLFGTVEEFTGDSADVNVMYQDKRSHLIYAPRHEVQGFLEVWYKFTPEYIDVTYEPEWAYEKKRYIVNQNNQL